MKKIIAQLFAISCFVSCGNKVDSNKSSSATPILNEYNSLGNYLFYENFDSLPLDKSIRYNSRGTVTENGKYYINKEHVDLEANNMGALATVLQSNFGKKANRAEIEVDIDKHVDKNNISNLSFDFFVPKTYELDLVNEGREVMIFQIHSQPEDGENWDDYRENIQFNRPSVAVYFGIKDNVHYLTLRYGLNGKPNLDFDNYKWFLAGIKEVQLGTWNTIKLSTKFSITNTGYIQAWLNNESFSAFNGKDNKIYGANMHNNALPYLKMGLYRYWADSHSHEVYYDNLRITSTIEELLSEEEKKYLNKYPHVNSHL
ncbi:heparin lyase I family protein [Oceanihabitans sediminis]|uniref:heparin lyase I family protein n=1 Tax=Oceanihabitans sediminis TaxID=1812012 RepID=UPI003A912E6A